VVRAGELLTLLRRGIGSHQQGDLEEAASNYQRVLSIMPFQFEALFYSGLLEVQRGNRGQAVRYFREASRIKPSDASVHRNLAIALMEEEELESAVEHAQQAVYLAPNSAESLNSLAVVLLALHRFDEAVSAADRALAVMPSHVEALNNRGNALMALRRDGEALACYEKALQLQPKSEDLLHNCGNALMELKRYPEAADIYNELLKLNPEYPFLQGELLYARMLGCDWRDFEKISKAISDGLRNSQRVAEPFGYQAASESEADLKKCSEIYAGVNYPPLPTLINGEKNHNPKIRIGYLCGEFREHATSILMAELFELHDRESFKVYAFDNGWDDKSDYRRRVVGAFEELVPISNMNDAEAANHVRSRGIDILVNLNGYFGNCRQGIFSRRPAPVQVNYLGFPATLGTEYIDYLVADNIVIPAASCNLYSEQIVYLPNSYQANDSKRKIAPGSQTRREAGLPERGFVFCCFNNNYKILPAIFDIWMRLLKKIEGSALWLIEDNIYAAQNLRAEAAKRGVDPSRLVFANRLRHDEHLARHRLADLFLDTLPYYAHTTASDALWVGLPIVSCRGATFPGRVGASLLSAVGLEELIAESLEEYERIAEKLARSPELLERYKLTLDRNRTTCPLFDCRRHTRYLEAAYVEMMRRYEQNEIPRSFSIDAV